MRGLSETKTKTVWDSESSSYQTGVSLEIPLKIAEKGVRHNESLTVGYMEFKLSSIQVIESQL